MQSLPGVQRQSRFRRTLLWAVAGACLALAQPAGADDRVSDQTFPPIALANHFSFQDKDQDLDLACGFLLRSGDRTYAVSAKHILRALQAKGIKGVKHVSLEGPLRSWSMFSKEHRTEKVILGALLNEEPTEKLDSARSKEEDWLVFEIKTNTATVQPLEARTTPLQPGERIFVVGWTSGQTAGPQRTYEFAYAKTIGSRLLLRDVVVPEKFGGLSGAPVVDAHGLLVGIVSGGTEDPATGKKMFSPCSVTSLAAFLKQLPAVATGHGPGKE